MRKPIGTYIYKDRYVHTIYDDGAVVRVDTLNHKDEGTYYIRLNVDGKLEYNWSTHDVVTRWIPFTYGNLDRDYVMGITEVYVSYIVETGLGL